MEIFRIGIYRMLKVWKVCFHILNSIRIFRNGPNAVFQAKLELCALGNDNNRTKIWELKDMDADHVTAWSKGGATDISNCQMLCKTHNRAKGNR